MGQPRDNAAQVSTRRRMMKTGAKTRLLMQLWPCVAAAATFILPTYLFSLLSAGGLPDLQTMLTSADPNVYLPALAKVQGMQLAFGLLLSPLSLGVYAYFVAVTRDQKPRILTVFTWLGEGQKLKTAFLANLWYTLLSLFWTVALAGLPALAFWGAGELFGRIPDSLALAALIVSALLLIAGLLLAYAKINSYLPAMFMLASNPGLPVRGTFSFCAQVMKGRVWEFFLFRASFFGWELLAALTYNISVFFVTPYIHLSVAAFTLQLMRSAMERKTLDND